MIMSIIYKLTKNYKSIELAEEKIRAVENGCLLGAELGRCMLSC